MNLPWLAPIVAFVLSGVVILMLRRPAKALGLVDRPGGRKQHRGSVPLIGGLGLLVAFCLASLLLPMALRPYAALYAGIVFLCLCGVVDDACELRSGSKLVGQLLAAVLMVGWGGVTLQSIGSLPGLGGDVGLGGWAVPVTVLAVVGFINALNMLDGADGVAGGVTLVMLAWLTAVGVLGGAEAMPALALTLAAAVAAFLVHNMRNPWRRKAGVFLGDAGSMALGLAIAWFAVEASQLPGRAVSPAGIAWIVALPVVDTLSLMVRRVVMGRSPFVADREHLHHVFQRAGYTVAETSYALTLVAAGFGAVGVFGSLAGVPDVILALGLLGVGVAHFVFIRRAWRTMRALKRLHAWTAQAPGGQPHAFAPGSVSRWLVPPVTGWRRRLALGGIYLLLFSLPLGLTGVRVGFLLVLAATVLALRPFLRDLRRLPVAWAVAALAALIALRGAFAAGEGFPAWTDFLWISGLLALPVGWWLAGARSHWLWCFLTLIAGGGAAFAVQADWQALETGRFGNPWDWGMPAVTGFIGAAVLMTLLGGIVAGLRRLGRGWRPLVVLAAFAGMSVPVVIVLVGTQYATGWIGALIGTLVIAVAAIAFGISRRQWMGLVGGASLLLVLALGMWTAVIGHPGPTRDAFALPLQAAALYAGGEPGLAAQTHAPTAHRLSVWERTAERFAQRPLTGWGHGGLPESARRYGDYGNLQSVYGATALAFGLPGLVLFAAVLVLLLRELLAVAREQIWPIAWVLGMLGAGAAMLAMLALSVQIHQPASRTAMIMVTAVYCAAMFQRRWLAEQMPARRLDRSATPRLKAVDGRRTGTQG